MEGLENADVFSVDYANKKYSPTFLSLCIGFVLTSCEVRIQEPEAGMQNVLSEGPQVRCRTKSASA